MRNIANIGNPDSANPRAIEFWATLAARSPDASQAGKMWRLGNQRQGPLYDGRSNLTENSISAGAVRIPFSQV